MGQPEYDFPLMAMKVLCADMKQSSRVHRWTWATILYEGNAFAIESNCLHCCGTDYVFASRLTTKILTPSMARSQTSTIS